METAQEFWAHVKIGQPNECWEWQRSISGHGYGGVTWCGYSTRPSKVALILTNGPIPEAPGYHGTCVLHRCDNPPCCNPTHLFLGTHKDNHADKAMKGRSHHPSGELNGRARITRFEARQIRIYHRRGLLARKDVLKFFPIKHTQVSNVINHISWGD